MSQDPVVIKAWQKGAELFGLGSGGSGHITGYSVQHQKLEEELADWLGYQRTILFTSGFAANQAIIYSLTDRHDAIIASSHVPFLSNPDSFIKVLADFINPMLS